MMADLFKAEENDLDVISLWQPWAQWVILGWKTIETRRHTRFACLAGRLIGIHAAKKWDVEAIEAAREWLNPSQIEETRGWWGRPELSGSLLGTVNVEKCRELAFFDSEAALIECRTQRFGLVLKYPVRFEAPLPMKGKQGIWKHRHSLMAA